ncbi:MAG: hypothetical protein K2Q34_06010 [Alphaproteobacteria bacterium]|nr:hypothetical protein [Alphaproteobacteria bacterium]
MWLIIVLAWVQYGHASTYFLNDEPLIFEKRNESICSTTVQKGNAIAIKMHGNKIDVGNYPAMFLPDDTSVMAGGIALSYLPSSRHVFQGATKYDFNRTVFDSMESIIFEAPDSISMLRRIVITRTSKGPIGFRGIVSFTDFFECMKGPREDFFEEEGLSLDLAHYFLIEGADRIEFVLDQETGCSS